jgi:hypothetical protein
MAVSGFLISVLSIDINPFQYVDSAKKIKMSELIPNYIIRLIRQLQATL